jgi:protein gp37
VNANQCFTSYAVRNVECERRYAYSQERGNNREPIMRSTSIEWTQHTWNPWTGCDIVSAGCTNCYAMRAALRLQEFGTPTYQGVVKIANGKPVWTGVLNRSSSSTWSKPFAIKQPALIFANSMSDFFHAAAPDEWRLEALQVMRATPRHQYQALTKRVEAIDPFLSRTGAELPPNMWAGATVERADVVHRIETLRNVPARIRFLSVEPLIGPTGPMDLAGIHWLILGGESGPGARPMRVEWARDVRDQCVAQRVPLFLKQFGRPENNPQWHSAPAGTSPRAWVALQDPVGKGGSTLDGRRHTAYPPTWRDGSE